MSSNIDSLIELTIKKPNHYKTIYLDPPWPEYGGGKIKRGADRHYLLMSLHEIQELPIYHLSAENSHLYMWATNNYLHSAFEIVEAWGFNYKTLITWIKDRWGLGQYFRGQTEHCVFAVRGNLPYKLDEDGKRLQGTTAILSPRRDHSRKPDEMRTMIEKVSYPPRIELFARMEYDGWDSWGNQIKEKDTLL